VDLVLFAASRGVGLGLAPSDIGALDIVGWWIEQRAPCRRWARSDSRGVGPGLAHGQDNRTSIGQWESIGCGPINEHGSIASVMCASGTSWSRRGRGVATTRGEAGPAHPPCVHLSVPRKFLGAKKSDFGLSEYQSSGPSLLGVIGQAPFFSTALLWGYRPRTMALILSSMRIPRHLPISLRLNPRCHSHSAWQRRAAQYSRQSNYRLSMLAPAMCPQFLPCRMFRTCDLQIPNSAASAREVFLDSRM
jgi:hypothetical protein